MNLRCGAWLAVLKKNSRHARRSRDAVQAKGFRIERLDAGNGLIVLLVSGRLSGEHVHTLGNALGKESGALAIDLKNVCLVDGDAVQLLALAESNATDLTNCPKYIREWDNRERAARDGASYATRHGQPRP